MRVKPPEMISVMLRGVMSRPPVATAKNATIATKLMMGRKLLI